MTRIKSPTYIPFFFDDLVALEPLGDAERGRLLTALLTYGMTGAAEKLSGNERFLFPMFRGRIDRFFESYTETCKKNRENVNKRYSKSTPEYENYDRIPNVPSEEENKSKKETIGGNNNIPPAREQDDPDLAEVMKAYQTRLGTFLSSAALQELLAFYGQFGKGIVLHALERAVDAGVDKVNWNYISGILRNYAQSGFSSLDDVLRAEADYQARRQQKPSAAKKSPTRKYQEIDDWAKKMEAENDGR